MSTGGPRDELRRIEGLSCRPTWRRPQGRATGQQALARHGGRQPKPVALRLVDMAVRLEALADVVELLDARLLAPPPPWW